MQTRAILSSLTELDWVHAKADIQYMTHGLHPYPARMIPQIASQLIDSLSQPGEMILDPFCGSGGVLVEAMLAGRNSIGIDLNPLACLLARVKTTPIDPRQLIRTWESIRLKISLASRFERMHVDIPDVEFNLDYWFKPETAQELALIRNHIDTIPNEHQKKFFQVCFSNTVRLVSGQRRGEFKLYRIPPEDWTAFKPDALEAFNKVVNRNISKMGAFYQALEKKTKISADVVEADTRSLLTDKFPSTRSNLSKDQVDLVVTSPPYGDSHTTVAYGQFSKLSLLWLGYSKSRTLEVDKQSIGGRRNGVKLESTTLDRVLDKVDNKKRAEEVSDFFVDLYHCLEKISAVLKTNSYACFVLGNRTVAGIKIPSDIVLSEICTHVGLEQKSMLQRQIPSKRIPWKSSPSNVPGEKVETISKENIVILRKS
jgi:DNA modification methylase